MNKPDMLFEESIVIALRLSLSQFDRMMRHLLRNLFALLLASLVLTLSAMGTVAHAKPIGTTTTGNCKISEGPNKGKTGTLDNGWCCTKPKGEGDCTECVDQSGKDNGKCEAKAVSKPGQEGIDSGVPPVNPSTAKVRVIPVTGTGSRPADYCRLQGTNLVVRLKNVGGVPAPRQAVTVTFPTTTGPRSRTVRSSVIRPGGTVDLAFRIPSNISSGDWRFTIGRANRPTIAGGCIG